MSEQPQATAEKTPNQDNDMSLIQHISELRFRVTRAAYGIFAGMAACWGFSDQIFNFVRQPIQQYLIGGGLVFTAPMDKFMAHIKLAFVAGLLLSSPFWLYQLWSFIAPALYRKEKKNGSRVHFFWNTSIFNGTAFQLFHRFANGI